MQCDWYPQINTKQSAHEWHRLPKQRTTCSRIVFKYRSNCFKLASYEIREKLRKTAQVSRQMRTLLRMSAQKSQTIWCQEQMSSASGKIPWRLKCTRIHVPQLFRRKELGSLLQKGNPLACRYAIREKMRIVNTNFRGITNAYIRRFSHCDDRTLNKCTELWSLACCWWRSIFKMDLSPWNSICLRQRLRELCRKMKRRRS